jgi:soluble lytic murein transglycosylase-like protein
MMGNFRIQKLLPVLGLLACLCAGVDQACADIYIFTDENGTANLSNVPAGADYSLLLHMAEPVRQVRPSSHTVDPARRNAYAPAIRRAASAYHLDPALLHAVIATESGFDARAVSRKGAMGLMQLMPETADRYGADDPFDADQNIRAGAHHLRDLMQRFHNDLPLVLAAYNSGEANVVKYGDRIPPFSETAAYVPKVIRLYHKYQRKLR